MTQITGIVKDFKNMTTVKVVTPEDFLLTI